VRNPYRDIGPIRLDELERIREERDLIGEGAGMNKDQVEVVTYEVDQFGNVREFPRRMLSPGDGLAIFDDTGEEKVHLTFSPTQITIHVKTTK
jgi:hypothetical protein